MNPLRVAVVGSGPSGVYAVGRMVPHASGAWSPSGFADRPAPSIEVDVYDRLPTPWGLVRAGVAPDHPEKRRVARMFDEIMTRPGVRFLGGVEVGRDVALADLRRWYDAVVVAVGASGGRDLPVPGWDLSGCHTAHDVVAWYNGHPDYADAGPDLSGRTAVVVGNGNVAIDVARVLIRHTTPLASTDVADGALARIRSSNLREVRVVGRRGAADAAFGAGELAELQQIAAADGFDLHVEAQDLPDAVEADDSARRRLTLLRDIASRGSRGCERRLIFDFDCVPIRVRGDDRVTGLDVQRHGVPETLPADLVIASIGYRASPPTGVPFETEASSVEHDRGRVLKDGAPLPGMYAVGWLKRGPSGMIGTNKACAHETIDALFEDSAAGRFAVGNSLSYDEVERELRSRACRPVSWAGWGRIDLAEQVAGRREGRPRVKVTNLETMARLIGAEESGG